MDVDPLTLAVALLRRLLMDLGVWPDPARFNPLEDGRGGDGSGVCD